MKWQSCLAQIPNKMTSQYESRHGLSKFWEPASCLLIIMPGQDCSLSVRRARILTVTDKDKGGHIASLPPQTHNDTVQQDDVFFWPAPDVSSCAAVQNFSTLCAGLCHCSRPKLILCRYFTVGECFLSCPGSLEFPDSQGQEAGRPWN